MVSVTYIFKNFSSREKILLGLDNIIKYGYYCKEQVLILTLSESLWKNSTES